MTSIFKMVKSVTITAFACCAIFVCGCESDSEIEANEDQREKIVNFLETKHDPKLISQSEISSSLVVDPEFYEEYGNYAFRFIKDWYSADRESRAEVKDGSKISINFRLYSFNFELIKDDVLPVFTNMPEYKSLYEEAGMNTTEWSFDPLEVVIGDTTLLGSLRDGLIGCREGDVVELYMTRNMGYGNDVIGTVEQWSALAFYCEIIKIE